MAKIRLGRIERAQRREAFSVRSDIVASNLAKPKPRQEPSVTNSANIGAKSARFHDPKGNSFKGGIIYANEAARDRRTVV